MRSTQHDKHGWFCNNFTLGRTQRQFKICVYEVILRNVLTLEWIWFKTDNTEIVLKPEQALWTYHSKCYLGASGRVFYKSLVGAEGIRVREKPQWPSRSASAQEGFLRLWHHQAGSALGERRTPQPQQAGATSTWELPSPAAQALPWWGYGTPVLAVTPGTTCSVSDSSPCHERTHCKVRCFIYGTPRPARGSTSSAQHLAWFCFQMVTHANWFYILSPRKEENL